MTNRDDRIDCHLTPENKARLLLGYSKRIADTIVESTDRVGKLCPTYGDLWNTDRNELVQGLLTVIATDLRRLISHSHTPDQTPLEQHRDWMLWERKDAIRDRATFRKELKRIFRFADFSMFGDLDVFCSPPLGSLDYRRNNHSNEHQFIQNVRALKKVKCLDDLITLPGIGKGTLEKIRQATLKRDKGSE